MKFVNLTPHTINIYCDVVTSDGTPTGDTVEAMVIPASGEVARVGVKPAYVFGVDGVDFYRQIIGDVVGLPEYTDDTILIVSAQVRLALPDRKDLASPGELKRNEAGQPVGCIGLYINKQS